MLDHKLLDIVQHLGVYIGGMFAIAGSVITFLWRDRNANKKRIIANEKQYEQLAWLIKNRVATKDDLQECSKEKDVQHQAGIKEVLRELKEDRLVRSNNNETNSQQHLDIMHEMARLHSK